jgi:hypothetical protein
MDSGAGSAEQQQTIAFLPDDGITLAAQAAAAVAGASMVV